MHLKHNIRYLRKNNGLSQEELADRVGKAKNNISSYENGRSTPPLETLLKMCDTFEVSLDELVNKNLLKEELTRESPSEPADKIQALHTHLLIHHIKNLAREIRELNEERYRELGLEELVRGLGHYLREEEG